MHELPWITIFMSRVRRFESPHEWQTSLLMVTNVLFYFLRAILCPDLTIPLKTIINRWFRHCREGWSFLTYHCDVTTVDQWAHANVGHWHCDVTTVDPWPHANAGHGHCDVIFFDCSCTRSLKQRRSSLVNNNREYWFLTTRYSWLSVQTLMIIMTILTIVMMIVMKIICLVSSKLTFLGDFMVLTWCRPSKL